MSISINIHNHTQAKKNYQENFYTYLQKLIFIDLFEKYFSLTGKLTVKGPNRVMNFILLKGLPGLGYSVSQLVRSKAGAIYLKNDPVLTKSLVKYKIISLYTINILSFFNIILFNLQWLLLNFYNYFKFLAYFLSEINNFTKRSLFEILREYYFQEEYTYSITQERKNCKKALFIGYNLQFTPYYIGVK